MGSMDITQVKNPRCQLSLMRALLNVQEDKEPLFDCADTLRACSQIADGVVTTLKPNKAKMLSVSNPPVTSSRLCSAHLESGRCSRHRPFQPPPWVGRRYPNNIVHVLLSSCMSCVPRFCHSPLPFLWEWELPKLMIRGR